MNLSVNGAPAPVPSPATVAALVAAMTETGGSPSRGTGGAPPTGAAGAAAKGIAVALNGEVVPRSAWDATDLHPGDRVEVLTAAQGG
jgi:sulfur carrier protein